MKQTPPPIENVAVHEAGHFVIRRHYVEDHFDCRLTVVSNGISSGSVTGESFSFDDGANPEGYVLSLFAGYEAEIKFDSESPDAELGAFADNQAASEIIRNYQLNTEQLRGKTRDAVNRHWSEILALSRFLLANQTLTGEAAEIFCDTFIEGGRFQSEFLLQQIPELSGAEDYFEP